MCTNDIDKNLTCVLMKIVAISLCQTRLGWGFGNYLGHSTLDIFSSEKSNQYFFGLSQIPWSHLVSLGRGFLEHELAWPIGRVNKENQTHKFKAYDSDFNSIPQIISCYIDYIVLTSKLRNSFPMLYIDLLFSFTKSFDFFFNF